MNPEEKFNQDVWWILQEIRNNEYLTPKGEKIEFCIRVRQDTSAKTKQTNTPNSPDEDTQRKLLYKLKEWKVVDDLIIVNDILRGSDIFTPLIYSFSIKQPKFDELYRLYDSGGNHSENYSPAHELNGSQSIIKPKSLELIAKEIGDTDSGSNLVEFLTNCGVKRELIEYPNTKWRMVYSVLLTLSSSENKDDRKTLFKIIEGACHPLMYKGDKNLAQKTVNKLNSFLEYDNFFIKDGILWEGSEDAGGIVSWDDKDGNKIEPNFHLILPKIMDGLYVYWNELIKLTKFYFNNKDNQDDEINNIYFEIITNVEEILDSEGCGGFKEMYKKPFRNIIGCEFEIQKQGLTVDGLFVNLYDFLGKITELSLPDRNNVEKIKKDNAELFIKIKQYTEQHLPMMEKTPEPLATKIEIIKMPELNINGFEKMQEPTNKKNNFKFPHVLPAGTTWEQFVIKFLDEENIFIKVKQYSLSASYKELGLIGYGGKPSVQWDFLKTLSRLNGELAITDDEARVKYKKQKETLAKNLQDYFSIEYDPFFPYHPSSEKESKSYKIKITLIPPPPEKNYSDGSEDATDDLGVKEYFDEQAIHNR